MEALWNERIGWCCIDRLSRQLFSTPGNSLHLQEVDSGRVLALEKARNRIAPENHERKYTQNGRVRDFEATNAGHNHTESPRTSAPNTDGSSKFGRGYANQDQKHPQPDCGKKPVPDRTMVATFDRVLLCWFRN